MVNLVSFFISITDHQKECLFPFLGEDPSLSSYHCTKNWIYSHLLMSKYDANAVQMCGKHGKCRIYFTFTTIKKQVERSLLVANQMRL